MSWIKRLIRRILRLLLDLWGFLVGGNGVTITVVSGPTAITNCGSVEWRVHWGVDPMRDGWIIQHVRFDADVRDCERNPRVPNNPDGLEYWEAWEVSGGSVWVGAANNGIPHVADTFRTADEGEGTRGTVIETGRVRFYERYDLREPPWGHTVRPAGALPTVTVEPQGVTDAGARDHSLTVEWICCPDEHKQTFTTSIRKTGLLGIMRTLMSQKRSPLKIPAPLNLSSEIMKNPDIRTIVDMFRKMPAWSDTPTKNQEARKIIIQQLEQLLHQDTQMLRQAMQTYINEVSQKETGYDVAAMSKLYIINRYIFNVTEAASLDKRRFASFYNREDTQNTIHSLWPLSFTGEKKLELTGVFQGYFGESYLALQEFDYLLKEYGRRTADKK